MYVKYAQGIQTVDVWSMFLCLFCVLGSNSRGTKAEEGSSATGDWVLQGTKV